MSDFHKGKRPDLTNLIYKSCKMNFPSNDPDWTISKPQYIDQRLKHKLSKLIDKYGIEMVYDYVILRKERHDKYSPFREVVNNIEDESLDTIDRPMTEEEMCCDTVEDYPPDGCGIGIGSSYRGL